jgi:FKBP-type peptidyl-prolyl cis-trans isomerase SlpA
VTDEGKIAPDRRVVMHYTLSLDDGTVAESSREGDPLTFIVGDGTIVEPLERLLYGLEAGARETFRLEPEEAFGYSEIENIHTIPRNEFPGEMPLDPGNVIGFSGPEGEEVPGTIMDVTEESVQVDFNHPLAGRAVVFEVEILSVGPGDDD